MTMSEPSLFDPPSVNSDTSEQAAVAIRPAAKTLRQKVLEWFSERGRAGGTDEECQMALGLRVQTQTPRRVELVRAGLLLDSSERRKTSSGRLATVWVVNRLNVPTGNA